MHESILKNSTAVRTIVHPDVRKTISSINLDLDSVFEYKTSIVNWLKPVVDLSKFYIYPTNGITEGLNWWIANEYRTIHIKKGDYQWVLPKQGNGDILYMSNPSAIDGNWKTIPTDIPVALDLAYVGSTAINPITIPENVEYVFYSLSKSFGIRNVRTGWLFTKKPDLKLDALVYHAKYYNYSALNVAEKIINNFSINYIHNKYQKQQRQICKELNIIESDSVWLATSADSLYNKFIRSENIARLCLAGLYNEKT